jgi:hypothetical protein
MDNYDLLSITIENEIFEKCYSLAFARLISGNSHKCEAAFSSEAVTVETNSRMKQRFKTLSYSQFSITSP